MKRIPLLFISILAVSLGLFAQDSEIVTLNQKIASLYQQGKFDEAIPFAEKVVSLEKKTAKNSEGHAIAVTNLAQLNKAKAKYLKTNLMKFEPRSRGGAYNASREAGLNAKELYREALNIYKGLKMEQTSAVAALKNELAWVVCNFMVTDSIGESRDQIDEAERLHTEALLVADNLSPANPQLQLAILRDFADFYLRYVNFEKALPLYERNLLLAESKYGPKAPQVLDGLRGLYEIYWVTGQETDLETMASRIKEISGTAIETPKYRDLTGRSRGTGKVAADGFYHTDFTDLDRSFRATAEIQRKLSSPNQYSVKSIAVDILVNEDGSVAQAKSTTPSKFTKQVEEAAMASKFRPYEYNGKRQKLRGVMYFRHKDY